MVKPEEEREIPEFDLDSLCRTFYLLLQDVGGDIVVLTDKLEKVPENFMENIEIYSTLNTHRVKIKKSRPIIRNDRIILPGH